MNRDKNNSHQIKGRDSNFELLRIWAMFMIIIGHMSWQAFEADQLSMGGRVFIDLFCYGSKIAVNLFLMIGIWFLVDSDFKASRVFKLYGSLWFYSIFITVALIVSGLEVSTQDKIYSFFPYLKNRMWFVPQYITLILLSPFLKKAYNGMSQASMRLLIIVGFFMIGGVCSVNYFMDTRLCATIWFIYIYFVIAYYKQYVSDKITHKYYFLFGGITIYFILVGGALVCLSHTGTVYNIVVQYIAQYLCDFKSIPNFICSFCIFIFFSKLDIGSNRVINELSKNTLDVYMIHQHPAFYMILWTVVCKTHSWQSSDYFILIYMGTAIALYLACSIVGRLRVRLIEPLWIKSKLFKKFCDTIDKLYLPITSDQSLTTKNR